MSYIITGEKIQTLCDVYLGFQEDFAFNPFIHKQIHKCLSIDLISKPWNNPRIIFCYPHRLVYFKQIMKYIENPFILVTHNSDENITSNYIDILENPKVLFWHAQNINILHPKLGGLPIGVANSMWPHGNLDDINSIINTNTNTQTKTKDFYFSFNISTNISARLHCKNTLERKGLSFDTTTLQYKDYLHHLSQYKYAICPPGNGIDCHRMWECFYLGVIPIVLKSPLTERINERFPCIVLDSWDDFNLNILLGIYSSQSFNLNIDDIKLGETNPYF